MAGVLHKLKGLLLDSFIPARKNSNQTPYNFNESNPLGGNGERVDINYNNQVIFEQLDVYQKSHYKRYEFAQSIVQSEDICGDFACGTGYGSMMLAEKAKQVIGADINDIVIDEIKKRYASVSKVTFLCENLLQLTYESFFNLIVSFETIEHFDEVNILQLLQIYNKSLKTGGRLIFSTPYMQEASEDAVKMGFHLTFYIDENKIIGWLKQTGFTVDAFYYQNYQSHLLTDTLDHKDFIICIARKEK